MGYTYEKGMWETKDHQMLKISEMETSHIQNVIKFLEKRPHFYDVYYDYFTSGDEYYYYEEENIHLVELKIEELQDELLKRRVDNIEKKLDMIINHLTA